MKILVDSDAMPRPLKEALYQFAGREEITTWFVAAFAPRIPASPYLRSIAAGTAFNGADDRIVEIAIIDDLVITADIPLADRALTRGAAVLNTKGEFFTAANIKNALAMRDLMEELRVGGDIVGGPPPFSDRQRVNFINALNRWRQQQKKRGTAIDTQP